MCRSHSNGDRSTHCNAASTAPQKQVVGYTTYCSYLPSGKRVYHLTEMCAGHLPTEIGRMTAMLYLMLNANKLSGTPLIANMCQLVNECTTCMHTHISCGQAPFQLRSDVSQQRKLSMSVKTNFAVRGQYRPNLSGKRVYRQPEMCAGHIPTEIGQATAMQHLLLNTNKLSGTPLIAQI